MRKLDGFLTLAAAILRSWTALANSGARIIAECPEAWPWYVNVTVRLPRIFDALRPSGRASLRKPLESRILTYLPHNFDPRLVAGHMRKQISC